MTTLWPVTYLYFDVLVLLVCAALVEAPWLPASRPGLACAATLAASVGIVVAAAIFQIPRTETSRYRKLDHEELLIPRLNRGDAVVDIDVITDMPQQMTALLNGTPLGTVTLAGGPQRISLAAPGRLWRIGVNELEPSFSSGVTRTTVERVTVK